jgi:phosphate transport system substrate-binding protein
MHREQEIGAMRRATWVGLGVAVFGLALPGCEGPRGGGIKIDGSSTVYLLSEAVAAQFKKDHAGVNTTVGLSGTGGGFKKFASGETDIQDASRAIGEAEIQKCRDNSVEYIEIQIAWDGIAVVVNRQNSWATKMTIAQLKRIWQPEGFARTWKDVDPSWPDEKIDLYGMGPDSGTFDYFTEAVNGNERVTRRDYNASGDPNTLAQGVANSKYALGYFGLAYYEANQNTLNDVAVFANGDGFIRPTPESVLARKYPLSRPLFIYLNRTSLERDEVREFARFYLRRTDLIAKAGYIPMSTMQHAHEKQKMEKAIQATHRKN